MDACAVSMSNGLAAHRIRLADALLPAFLFGLFQALMPIIGYFAGSVFAKWVMMYDHWLAFILLGFIGGRMIYEALKHDPAKEELTRSVGFRVILLQAVATSIDALIVGVSLIALEINIFLAALIIALTTFALSFASVYIGHAFGRLFSQKAEIAGGVILIGIGVKTLVSHLMGG